VASNDFVKELSRLGLTILSMVILAPASAGETGVDVPESAKLTPGANGAEVRRVWVLSEPTGYGSGNRTREIVIYDVTCEEGKMNRASESFQSTGAPGFGAWVLRTQTGPTGAGATQEQLQRALADVCGV
jgi:hypothetical protein